MNCREVRGLVQEHVARALGPDDRRRVDEHLLECEECRRELALMSAVISGLETGPVEEPASGFSGRVLAVLPRQRGRMPSPLWVLAAAPVLFVLVWLLRQPLASGLTLVLGWFGVDIGRVAAPALPALTGPQLVLVAVAVGLAAVGATVTTAVLTWRRVSE